MMIKHKQNNDGKKRKRKKKKTRKCNAVSNASNAALFNEEPQSTIGSKVEKRKGNVKKENKRKEKKNLITSKSCPCHS